MPSSYLSHLQCPVCKATYAPNTIPYTCPACGEVGALDMVYDYAALRRDLTPATISAHQEWTMWRYRPLLPVIDDTYIPPLPVGWTPLVPAPRLAERFGLAEVWLKDDGRNPTASLKDRASAMVVARAREIGADAITTASSGNAAAALAGVCASVGLRPVIFVPKTAPQAKVTQLLIFGARVFLVDGTYDDAFDLSVKAAHEFGWYCRNTGMNPYTTEGKKTAAFEIAEQLGWYAPDAMLVSVGDGNIIAGQYKGFYDLHQLGWIDHMPRLIGVQAAGSAPFVRAWEAGRDPATMPLERPKTIADSISVGFPRDRVKGMRAVRATNGAYLAVSDAAILAAIPDLARATGVFAEPAAATAYAGLKNALEHGMVRRGERVVVLITGSGLKDIASAIRSAESEGAKAETILPTLAAVREAMEKNPL
ncbi:MAG TPA: threonine synthase [Aggregatilineales bacterium]|nr:threonine synthase [Anaerolineales bacterium]HRE47024.1 threonine synthase [Aggregatilineales bacterium]